jgi:hypothetical protein
MYSRATCGLCDEAREVIGAVRAEIPFDYEELFVDGRDDLERAYGVRLPVVLVNGQERFEVHVDSSALRRAVAGAGA